jgi:hypothetical protein
MNFDHPRSYECPQCGRAIPRNDVSRLIHLKRRHPARYATVESAYLDAVAERNDVSRAALGEEPEAPAVMEAEP